MSPQAHRQLVPRGVLIAAGIMMATSIGFAAAARRAHLASPPAVRPPIESVVLAFTDRTDGTILVTDAGGREVSRVQPGTNGFIRGVLRGMFRTRKLESLGREGRFVLAREADGHLSLTDPETGRRVELDSFGPTNTAAFADLLKTAQH